MPLDNEEEFDSVEIKGTFSWGFSEKKKDDGKGTKKTAKKKKNEKEPVDETPKKLSQFTTLKSLDLKVKRGEFVCVIGDVGSGKSSLLSALIGDMIYLPEKSIDNFGGPDELKSP